MFGFGDELVIQKYGIPWVIWIQVLVTLLLTLVILLSFFDFFALDSSPTSSDSLSSASAPHFEHPSTCSPTTQEPNEKERDRISGNNDVWVERATHRRSRTRGTEETSDTDASSVEELTPATVPERFCHPCHFIDLAKEAFLRCLGLGSSSWDSQPRDRKHQD